MQISGILRYAISRKRSTVNTQQGDEGVFYLDSAGKSSSETVNDIRPTASPRIHFLPLSNLRTSSGSPKEGGDEYARLIYCTRKLYWLSLLAEILILRVLAT